MPADAAYYPLNEGSRWTYHAGDGEEVEETVRTMVTVDGGEAAALSATSGAESYYVVTEDGIVRFFQQPADQFANAKGTWLLRFPVRLGDQWESWTPVGLVEFYVAERGPIKTESTTFPDAVKVEFVAVPEPLFSGHIWYARDVGPVIVAEDDYTRRLVNFQVGEQGQLELTESPSLVPPPVQGPQGNSLRIVLFVVGVGVILGAVILLVPRVRKRVSVSTFNAPAGEGESRHRWLAAHEASEETLLTAAAELEAQIRTKPNYADLRCKLGEVYLELTRLEDAVVQLQEAVKINPNYTQARILLANALLKLDHAPQALDALQPAADEHPEYADVRNLMGEIHRATGDLSSARVEFKAALEVNPNFERAAKNLEALDEGMRASIERRRADRGEEA